MGIFGGPNIGAKRGNLEDLNIDTYRGAILGTVIQVCIEMQYKDLNIGTQKHTHTHTQVSVETKIYIHIVGHLWKPNM